MKIALTDEQNYRLMHDARVVAAQKELDDAVASIKDSIAFEGANAGYLLTVLPQKLNRLQKAHENQIIIEELARLEIVGVQV